MAFDGAPAADRPADRPAQQDEHGSGRTGPPRLRLAYGAILLAAAIVLLTAGLAGYQLSAPHGVNLVRLQWAGSSANAIRAAGAEAASYRLGLWRDLELAVPGATLGLLAACYLGRRVFWTRQLGSAAAAGMAAALAAGVLGAVADWVLVVALDDGLHGTWIFRAAQALSLARYSALLVAAVIGMLALATALGRIVLHRSTARRWESAIRNAHAAKPDSEAPLAIPPPPVEVPAGGKRSWPADNLRRSWWLRRSGGPRAHWAQGFALPTGPEPGGTGICVSGGGIRSASVTLGALQALRQAGVLADTRHLISVSGGGFTVGGFQLALMPRGGWPRDAAAQEPDPGGATPADVFDAGSPEEDHLRRHSSYIAADFRQWAVALGMLFRGVASSFVVIGLVVTALGLGIGRFYHYVPVVANGDLAVLRPSFMSPGRHRAPPFPGVPPGVWLAIGAAAVLGALGYLALGCLPGSARRRRAGLTIRRISGGLAAGATLLAVAGVALPALIWAGSWLSWQVKLSGTTAVTAGSLSLLLSYLGTIAATLWRNRTTLAKEGRSVVGLLARKGPATPPTQKAISALM